MTPKPLHKKGGRPRRPVTAEILTLRERLLGKLEAHSTGARTLLTFADWPLAVEIVQARHGERGRLMQKLARRKKISHRTAWTLLPQLRAIAAQQERLQATIDEVLVSAQKTQQQLRPFIRSYPRFEALIGSLPASAVDCIADELVSGGVSVEADLVNALIELSKSPHR